MTGPQEDTQILTRLMTLGPPPSFGNRAPTVQSDETAADVTINRFGPSPRIIEVRAGQPIRFSNAASATYTLVIGAVGVADVCIRPGRASSQKIQKPGRYAYHCRSHPQLCGEIIVL